MSRAVYVQKIMSIVSDEEAKNELKRREEASALREVPMRFMNPNLAVLNNLLDNYMKSLVDNEEMKDGVHWIYECVMTTFYGSDIFNWINKHT